MKKLLALLAIPILAVSLYAELPLHSNIATCNLSKVTGDYDSFRWTWANYDTQTNSIFFVSSLTDTSTNYVDLTGCLITFRMTRMDETGLVTVLSTTNVTLSVSNVQHTIAASNVPSAGTYFAEYRASDSATNVVRTLGQGKITVFRSLLK